MLYVRIFYLQDRNIFCKNLRITYNVTYYIFYYLVYSFYLSLLFFLDKILRGMCMNKNNAFNKKQDKTYDIII